MAHILIFIHWFVLVFTFGNVELVTIDNSKSNDFPIEELGNKSLREYFEDENLISNTWGNRANTTHAIVNNELVVTATLDGTTIGVQKELSYNGNYYYAIVFKSDSLNTFHFAQTATPLDLLQVNTYQQNSGLKSFTNDSTFRLYQSLLTGQTFTVKYVVFIQTELSKERMDYWFNLYQENAQREISETYDYIENELTTNDLIYIVLFALLWGLAIKFVKGVM